jgi:hypothetical protein
MTLGEKVRKKQEISEKLRREVCLSPSLGVMCESCASLQHTCACVRARARVGRGGGSASGTQWPCHRDWGPSLAPGTRSPSPGPGRAGGDIRVRSTARNRRADAALPPITVTSPDFAPLLSPFTHDRTCHLEVATRHAAECSMFKLALNSECVGLYIRVPNVRLPCVCCTRESGMSQIFIGDLASYIHSPFNSLNVFTDLCFEDV